MATPQSTASYDASGEDKELEQITFRFCSECSNMLYPKEDEESHKLQYTCRTCQYTEEATTSCVFRNILENTSGETAGVTQDVGSDPTVSVCLSGICISCGDVIRCRVCGSISCAVGSDDCLPADDVLGLAPIRSKDEEMFDDDEPATPLTEEEFFARLENSSFQIACVVDDSLYSATSADEDARSFTDDIAMSLCDFMSEDECAELCT